MKTIWMSVVALALTACAQEPQPTQPQSAGTPAPSTATAAAPIDVPAGTYTLDLSHGSLLFRVDHLGFSMYTARFKDFEATLELDPKALEQAKLSATIDVKSLETDYPDPSTVDFNAQLLGSDWLNAAEHPQMTFVSTQVQETAPNRLSVTGDLTLRGVTKPVTLDATFNGGYRGHPMDPNARIGFSARGTLKRSDFGISYGIPAPGTKMGVGDDVEIIIETEFTGPPMQTTAPSS